jgi:alkylhydroperoxidase/carboxymuconolactone decarboxylase family protein YurZ
MTTTPKRELPGHYISVRNRFPEYYAASENFGTVLKQDPLDDKTDHFVQLAAAAAIRPEGAVHSHVRRAVDAGAKPEGISHSFYKPDEHDRISQRGGGFKLGGGSA